MADKSQLEKVWRTKNDGSPRPAHVNKTMPLPALIQPMIVILEIYHSIEMEYEEENLVGKYVDCHTACPQRSAVVTDTAHERTFVSGADIMHKPVWCVGCIGVVDRS
jgi:hypothetical protein